MSEEREKVRCRSCELVQWSDRANCRRCGNALPEPIVRIVERVVEKIVIRQDPQCLQKLEQASRLISTATERLAQQCVKSVDPIVLAQVPETGVFPTMAEMERGDHRGSLREIKSQTSRSCPVARNRQDHRIPQAQRNRRSGGVMSFPHWQHRECCPLASGSKSCSLTTFNDDGGLCGSIGPTGLVLPA